MIKEKKTSAERGSRIAAAIALPVSVCALEIMLRAAAGMKPLHDGLPGALLTALAFAFIPALLASAFKSGKAGKWISFIWLELLTIWFTVSYFTADSYKVFMAPEIILNEAGNAAKNFGGNVANVFTLGLKYILMFQIPALLFLIFNRALRFPGGKRGRRALIAALLTAFSLLGGYLASRSTDKLREQYDEQYTYDNAVRNFGLLSGLVQDIVHEAEPDSVSAGQGFTAQREPQEEISEPEKENEQSTEKSYEPNIMDIDFEHSNPRGEPVINELNAYVQSLKPSMKNEYTGLFEGKNLILITAEAFSKEVIDPQRTPALYRMANKGIVFEDFYQPAWGGSTSTGEFSWLSGIAPTVSTAMVDYCNNNHYFTMGNQLQRQGYFSRAYHNGSYQYYSRDLTHTNLGYSEFYGIGNGLEKGLSPGFPKSDLEMIDFTLPDYIDKEPFSVYYMSISGHASYKFDPDINDMSVKNEAVTEGMDNSEDVRAYYACNQELEYAVESLIKQLEEAGIADDTVIALVADHYPYGLMSSAAWGNSEDALAELYGYKADTDPRRDHNQAIIWCGCLEDREEPIRVSSPSSSLDLLPTLSNLFGLEFDSRLLPGRDVLSEKEALVFWNDHCWLTDKGYYDSSEREFIPNEGVEADEEYVERIKAEVKDKLYYSALSMKLDYFGALFGPDEIK